MTTAQEAALMDIAGATADLLVFSGCVPSLGDDKVEALAEALSAFLQAAGASIDKAAEAAYFAEVHDQDREFEALAKADRSSASGSESSGSESPGGESPGSESPGRPT